ncbi:MAG TPA: response regulator transcription factor [Actinomycetes bacterium]
MTDGRVRVLVADDHAPTRAGVRASLDADGFEVVAEASNARQAVSLALELKPDVCLLDIHMPGSGIAAAEELMRELPNAAVVVLTYSRDDDDLFDALRAGARGYLLKDMDPDRLGAALHGVLAGEAALPRSLVAKVLDEFQGRSRRRLFVRSQRPTALTSREWEIMELLRQGLSTEDVARRLFVSPGTVRVHVSSVLKKLQVPDRATAIRMLDQQ